MSICARCGTSIPAGAQFCPRCGANLAERAAPATVVPPPVPPPPAPTPAVVTPEPQGKAWWIVPLVLLLLIGGTWMLLKGLPFGREDDVVRPEAAEREVIAEGTAGNAAEVVRDAEGVVTEPGETAATVPPPNTAPPIAKQEPAPAPVPDPVPTAPEREITEDQAIAVLRGFVATRDDHHVPAECLRITSRGYQNAGYTLELFDTCRAPGEAKSRWRIDSKTREVFLQKSDGRYLRP